MYNMFKKKNVRTKPMKLTLCKIYRPSQNSETSRPQQQHKFRLSGKNKKRKRRTTNLQTIDKILLKKKQLNTHIIKDKVDMRFKKFAYFFPRPDSVRTIWIFYPCSTILITAAMCIRSYYNIICHCGVCGQFRDLSDFQ